MGCASDFYLNALRSFSELFALFKSRASTALGAFYRRLAARVGKARAITATARKGCFSVAKALK
jgi:transposase